MLNNKRHTLLWFIHCVLLRPPDVPGNDEFGEPPEEAAQHVPVGRVRGRRAAETLGTVPHELRVAEVAEVALKAQHQQRDGGGQHERQVEAVNAHTG